jgi:hypothetical protein
MAERPISHVPAAALALLAAAFAAQVGVHRLQGPPMARAGDLPLPPHAEALRLAVLGEPIAASKLMLLYVQAFDYQAGTQVAYRELDYDRLASWLQRILELDPPGQYPLFLASRVYADVADGAKARRMLELVHDAYLQDPNRRWPWLAHATLVAKHRLKDLPLARRYAVSLQTHTTARDAPLWVRQMEPFILEDMNELESARVLLGGLIASGQVKDERDLQLLERHLASIEERQKAAERNADSAKRREVDNPDGHPTPSPYKQP